MNNDKTKEQLEAELRERNLKDSIIQEGHGLWANKLTQKIVFGLCALILTGAIVAILNATYNYNTIVK